MLKTLDTIKIINMKNTPEKIYLQIWTPHDESVDFNSLPVIDWYRCRRSENDLEYEFVPKPRLTPLKDKIIAFSFTSVFLFGLLFFAWYSNRDRVVQEPYKIGCDIKYVTWVWVGNNIVQAWYDPIDLSDSLKAARKIEGERIIKTIK